ncbi:hypothetical protein APHAL10511_001504 [Amanita phalloides]|nr:hypothetical protein APHAL10511_001504 [Amanita phalloides]
MHLSLLPNLTEILHNQLYIGNLSAAMSERHRQSVGVTHILSVCPDYPSTDAAHHLTIAVHDSEYEDLLIHLPQTCEFIEKALNVGGRVLVHCVMGISRSTTVVAAYLMKSRGMDAMSAIKFIKKARPQVHPNYGFITQLVTDTTTIVPGLLLSSGFPEDSTQAEWLLLDLGITHLLTLSPCKNPSTLCTSTTLTRYKHMSISDQKKGDLLVALPEAVKFVSQAFGERGTVLVHCLLESRACTVVCASLMEMKNMAPDEAFGIIEDVLPLFNPTRNFSRHLELFAACGYNPTREHYLVRDWIRSQTMDPYSVAPALASSINFFSPSPSPSSAQAQHAPSFGRSPSLVTSRGSSTVSSPAPSTPASSRTSSASNSDGPSPLAGVYPPASEKDSALGDDEGEYVYPCGYSGDRGYLVAKAMEVLGGCESDGEGDGDRANRFDLSAFGRALVAIQEREGGR